MDYGEVIKGDKLVLRGLKFHGFHGVKPEEKKLGQKFLVDVDTWMDLQTAGKSDKLSDTISYTEIYCKLKTLWRDHLIIFWSPWLSSSHLRP
ncbi:Dihydroneopterin aldolase [Actinidia chinensis var. chinensis]|uniref:dihydroneopterin aldolase n=1 Tax=Actinidia chinensis var. chinensis TaxID=1590841 RepID=A0A2R6R7L4_ACTCC|nr:Dihydroneopterin aldolase [Actinidia chinensis var. chinensis]